MMKIAGKLAKKFTVLNVCLLLFGIVRIEILERGSVDIGLGKRKKSLKLQSLSS